MAVGSVLFRKRPMDNDHLRFDPSTVRSAFVFSHNVSYDSYRSGIEVATGGASLLRFGSSLEQHFDLASLTVTILPFSLLP